METTLEKRVELATCVYTVNRDDSSTSVDIDQFVVHFLRNEFVSGAVIRELPTL